MNKKIVFIAGVSGSGKSTLIRRLREEKKEKISIMASYSSREMRPGEDDGDPYYFVAREEFEQMIDDEEILEYNEYVGNLYGTAYHVIDDARALGKIPVKEIDVNGLIDLYVEQKIPGEFVSVFLTVDDDVIIDRLDDRGDEGSQDQLERRLDTAHRERELAAEYVDYVIDASQSPDDVYDEVIAILERV